MDKTSTPRNLNYHLPLACFYHTMYDRSFFYYVAYVLKFALYPLTILYGIIVWVRNKLYDAKFFSSIAFSLPVITVGNLSTGGTGKTPHVEYLINLLQYRYRVATMSRGYKRRTQGFLVADETADARKIGDEPMQFHMKFPELTVSVAEDRIIGIPLLLQRCPHVEVIILDDAYQHRSVRAGLNVLITDYAHPFYKDHILPFGNLRESRNAYKRANIIIVSKCNPAMTNMEADAITMSIAPLPTQQVFFTHIAYGNAYDMYDRETVSLAGKKVILVCCIARPEPLTAYLRQASSGVHTITYHDHHYFTTQDVEEIKAAYDNWDTENKIIITTEKDATRLHLHTALLHSLNMTITVLPITVQVMFGKGAELDNIVLGYTEGVIAENNEVFGNGG